ETLSRMNGARGPGGGDEMRGAALSELQGVVMTASALVDLLGQRLGLMGGEEGPGGGDSDADEVAHEDSFLDAMVFAATGGHGAHEATPAPGSSWLVRPPLVSPPIFRTTTVDIRSGATPARPAAHSSVALPQVPRARGSPTQRQTSSLEPTLL
ncbi:unnamed protein product, partial [Polarella glacialis]